MLSALLELWLNGQWASSSRTTNTYDATENMLSWSYETWSNGQLANWTRYMFAYDAQGNMTSVWDEGWLDSTWTPVEGSFGVQDSAGNFNAYQGYNFAFTRKLWVFDVVSESDHLPASCSLSQNYPNPFNPSTTIQFTIVSAQSGSASAKKTADRSGGNRLLTIVNVYDVLGRVVATLVNEVKQPGTYTVQFSANGGNGPNLASGVYFYRLQAGSFVQTKKLLLLR
jgi:hypothetical protein